MSNKAEARDRVGGFLSVGVNWPLSSEGGTHTTVKARFRPWLSDTCPENLARCSLFARKRDLDIVGGLLALRERPGIPTGQRETFIRL